MGLEDGQQFKEIMIVNKSDIMLNNRRATMTSVTDANI